MQEISHRRFWNTLNSPWGREQKKRMCKNARNGGARDPQGVQTLSPLKDNICLKSLIHVQFCKIRLPLDCPCRLTALFIKCMGHSVYDSFRLIIHQSRKSFVPVIVKHLLGPHVTLCTWGVDGGALCKQFILSKVLTGLVEFKSQYQINLPIWHQWRIPSYLPGFQCELFLNRGKKKKKWVGL